MNKLKVSLIILLLLLFMVSCSSSNPVSVAIGTVGNFEYSYVIVDGMVCLQGSSGYGLTCDWTKWEGTVDGSEVVLPTN